MDIKGPKIYTMQTNYAMLCYQLSSNFGAMHYVFHGFL